MVAILIASQLDSQKTLDTLYTLESFLQHSNILLLDQAIKNKLFVKQNPEPELPILIEKLKGLDHHNGLPFTYSTIYHARKNNLLIAFEELNKIAKKNMYNDFYWKRFSTLLNTLQEASYPKEHLYTASVKFSHNIVFQPYKELMNLCNEQSKSSVAWKNSCIQVGKLLEHKGTIFFANMVGFALQREALKHDIDDAAALKKVMVDREILNHWRVNALKNLDFIEAQKKGPDSYYNDLVQFGERKAVENAIKLLPKPYKGEH